MYEELSMHYGLDLSKFEHISFLTCVIRHLGFKTFKLLLVLNN